MSWWDESTKCGAGRFVKVVQTSSSDGPNDRWIDEVDGVTVSRRAHYLGCGDAKNIIARCHRCTGKLERECDLSHLTCDEPEPQ